MVTPEQGCGTHWQHPLCCRNCSARVQSWHLCAPCLTGITRLLIRFLRSKNTGGIPPPPNTTVRTLLPLSPVPGGRGFLWIAVFRHDQVPFQPPVLARKQVLLTALVSIYGDIGDIWCFRPFAHIRGFPHITSLETERPKRRRTTFDDLSAHSFGIGVEPVSVRQRSPSFFM